MPAELISRATTVSPSEFLIVQYMCVVGITILLCDYLHTLELEVSLIWPRKWTIVKIIFLQARYLPFLDVPLMFSFYFYPNNPNSAPEVFSQKCRALGTTATWLFALGIGATELILVIRTQGLVGGTKRFWVYLIVQLMVVAAAILAIIGISTPTWNFIPTSYPYGCNHARLIGNTRILLFAFIVVLIHEIILTSIMLYTGFVKHRHERSLLIRTLYRDGIIYFALTSFTSLANIIVIAATPQQYTGLFAIPQRVIHSVLATRIVLQVREAALREEVIEYQLSDLDFGTRMTRRTEGTEFMLTSQSSRGQVQSRYQEVMGSL